MAEERELAAEGCGFEGGGSASTEAAVGGAADSGLADERLRTAHFEIEQLFEALPSVLIVVDHDNRIVQLNGGAERTLGIVKDDVVGRSIDECMVECDWKNRIEDIDRCRREKRQIALDDIRFTRPDGREGFLGVTLNPIIGAGGWQSRVLILGADITERRELEAQLVQSQKLESIGQLAAGIAHEINTPTQYVGDNLRFLKDCFGDLGELLSEFSKLLSAAKEGSVTKELAAEVEEAVQRADMEYLTEEIPKAIDESLSGVERIASIVRAMKNFSHPDMEGKVATDINKAIESTIVVSRNEWKYVAELKTDFDPNMPLVPCLPGDFNQVILNIIVNAAHAIADVVGGKGDGKGEIKVSTRHVDGWAEIRISDTGTGIPPEIRHRIFDPFFTTKGVGRGTGQGLSIARSIVVDKHGGELSFETEDGKGTTFIIRLPIDNLEKDAEKADGG